MTLFNVITLMTLSNVITLMTQLNLMTDITVQNNIHVNYLGDDYIKCSYKKKRIDDYLHKFPCDRQNIHQHRRIKIVKALCA